MKIISCNLNVLNKTSEITIYGYYNQTARDENKLNLDYRIINCVSSDFNQYFSIEELDNFTNPIQQAYLYIKTQNEFIGSTDI